MKRAIGFMALVLISFSMNFGVFLYSYRMLAFPHLHEAQRMENAPLIFSYVLAGFLVGAVITAVVARLLHRKNA